MTTQGGTTLKMMCHMNMCKVSSRNGPILLLYATGFLLSCKCVFSFEVTSCNNIWHTYNQFVPTYKKPNMHIKEQEITLQAHESFVIVMHYWNLSYITINFTSTTMVDLHCSLHGAWCVPRTHILVVMSCLVKIVYLLQSYSNV